MEAPLLSSLPFAFDEDLLLAYFRTLTLRKGHFFGVSLAHFFGRKLTFSTDDTISSKVCRMKASVFMHGHAVDARRWPRTALRPLTH